MASPKGGGVAARGERARARASGGATAVAEEAGSPLETPSGAKLQFRDLTPAEEKAQMQTVSKLLGKNVSEKDIASMLGAPDDAVISMHMYSGKEIKFYVKSDAVAAQRTLKRDSRGNLYIHNDEIVVGKDFRGQGIGPKMVAKQIHFAAKLGVKYLDTNAARLEVGGTEIYVGYKVWPRMGYDGPLPQNIRDSAPKSLGKISRMRDVMATKEGRDWWEKDGGESIDLKFDLTPGSYSRETLKKYLKAKGYDK